MIPSSYSWKQAVSALRRRCFTLLACFVVCGLLAVNITYAAEPTPINFNSPTVIEKYNPQEDQDGQFVIEDNGATLYIYNNTWKRIDIAGGPYTVTANTILEFDFSSTKEGEVQGIGFDKDTEKNNNWFFQAFGTQDWTAPNYSNPYLVVWAQDTGASPSSHVNAVATGEKIYSVSDTIDMSNVRSGLSQSLFQKERWAANQVVMEWDFAVTPGEYEVRLYFAELYHSDVNLRVMDVRIEGVTELNDYDQYADAGARFKAIEKTFDVTSDANLDIDLDASVNNPSIKGIEIIEKATGEVKYAVNAGGSGFTDTASGQWRHYRIRVGDYFKSSDLGVGDMIYLIFLNDHDADPRISNSRFRNVKLYEEGQDVPGEATSSPLVEVDFGSATIAGFNSSDNVSNDHTLEDNDTTLKLSGNTWKKIQIPGDPYHVTANTVLEFDFKSTSEGEVHGLGLDQDEATPTLSPEWFFSVFGTEVWGNPKFDDRYETHWLSDESTSPSEYVNATQTGNRTYSIARTIDLTHASVPGGTPQDIFQIERWAEAPVPPATEAPLQWAFPVHPGDYLVRLYFAEIYNGITAAGQRTFDVKIEGVLKLNDYDVYNEVGGDKGIVESFTVTSDGTLNIDLYHEVNHPAIKAIEILNSSTMKVIHAVNAGGAALKNDPSGDWRSYRINVGDYFTSGAPGAGPMDYFVFGVDHDIVSPDGNSYFRNVKLFEQDTHVIWVGGTSSSWNTATNWSPQTVPGPGEVAVFNSSSSANCSIDTNVNVRGIWITGYTGTLTQGGTETITVGSAGVKQTSGTFTGDDEAITISGDFALFGGQWTSTSATMSVGGDFTFSGGTFTHNSGEVDLTGSYQRVAGDISFWDLTKTESISATVIFAAGDTVTVLNDATLEGDAGEPLLLLSDTEGQQWNLDIQGTYSAKYLEVRDSDYVGTGSITAGLSTGLGNNTSWVVESKPVVVLADPSASGTINLQQGEGIQLSATVSTLAPIAKVQFLVDDVLIDEDVLAAYAITWTPQSDGSQTLKAVAIDTLGRTSDPSTVVVDINDLPTVAITSPDTSQGFATSVASIVIDVDAADADGISSVEVFRQTHGETTLTSIGSDTVTPYSVTWSSPPDGRYDLIAVATDANDGETTSTPVSIYVGDYPSASGVRVIASDGAGSDYFGQGVAVSDTQLFVGAHREDDGGADAGKVYIYEPLGDGWQEVGQLISSDIRADDYFGYSLAVDGQWLVVGAHRADGNGGQCGAAYVFRQENGQWTEWAKLTADDQQAGDFFGYSVDVSGNRIVVGAYLEDRPTLTNAGAAYVYDFNVTSQQWEQTVKLLDANADGGDYFGWTVACSGDDVIVGSPLDDTPSTSAGSIHHFRWNGTSWDQHTLNGANGGDEFGTAVDIRGDYLLVGAHKYHGAAADSGSAFLYRRSGAWNAWGTPKTLERTGADTNHYLGYSVALSDDYAVLGAYNANPSSVTGAGLACLYNLDDFDQVGIQYEIDVLNPTTPVGGANMGHAVAISAQYVTAGAYKDHAPDSDSGSAYVFPLESLDRNPTVAITSPTNNAMISRSSATEISIDASSWADSIDVVNVLVNGVKIGQAEQQGAPDTYKFNWLPDRDGYHEIVVEAADTQGRTTRSAATTVHAFASMPYTSNMAFWLIADLAEFDEQTGQITSWDDISGNGLTVTFGVYPDRVGDVVQGKAVARFDGVSDYLRYDVSPDQTYNDNTIFVVFRVNDEQPTPFSAVFGTSSYPDVPDSWQIEADSNKPRNLVLRTDSHNDNDRHELFPISTEDFVIVGTVLDSGSLSRYLNGSLIGQPLTLPSGQATSHRYYGLGITYTNNFPMACDIAEVMVFTEALSPADRQSVEAYLKARYMPIMFTELTSGQILEQDQEKSILVDVTNCVGDVAEVSAFVDGQWVDTAREAPFTTRWTPKTEGDKILKAVARDAAGNVLGDVRISVTVNSRAIPHQDLAIWLRADRGVTLESGAVSRWLDQADHIREFKQDTVASRPVLIQDHVNGNPVIRFDGSDDYMDYDENATLDYTGDSTVFVVFRVGDSVLAEGDTVFTSSNSAVDMVRIDVDNSTPKRLRLNCDASNRYDLFEVPTDQFVLVTVKVDDSTISLFENGNQIGSTVTSTGTLGTKHTYYRLGVGTNHFHFIECDVAELLVYHDGLANTDREAVEKYLTGKYNLGSSIAITSPTQDQVFETFDPTSQNITIAMTVTDAVEPLDKVVIYDGTSIVTEIDNPTLGGGGSLNYVWSGLELGPHHLSAHMIDANGNVFRSGVVDILVTSASSIGTPVLVGAGSGNDHAPTVNAVYPADGSTIAAANGSVSIVALYSDEDGTPISLVELRRVMPDGVGEDILGSQLITQTDSSFAINIGGLTSGAYTYKLILQDADSHLTEYEFDFTVDAISPVVGAIDANEAAIDSGIYPNAFNLYLQSTEAGTIYYSTDGYPPSVGGGNTTAVAVDNTSTPDFVTSAISVDANKVIQAFAVDSAGNVGTTQVWHYQLNSTVDPLAANPTVNFLTGTTQVQVSWTAVAGVDGYHVYQAINKFDQSLLSQSRQGGYPAPTPLRVQSTTGTSVTLDVTRGNEVAYAVSAYVTNVGESTISELVLVDQVHTTPVAAANSAEAIARSLQWTLANQQATGVWSADGVDSHAVTAAVLEMLADADGASLLQSHHAARLYARGIQEAIFALRAQVPDNNDSLARGILALDRFGHDASAAIAILVAKAELEAVTVQGWGLQNRYQPDPISTALGIGVVDNVASVWTGVDVSSARTKLTSDLKASHATDTRYGWVPGGNSEIYASLLVKHFGSTSITETWIYNAQVNTAQDGAFNDRLLDTAAALLWLGMTDQTRIDNAIGYLLREQQEDGSWSQNAYLTAICAAALIKHE